jgi:hypothetical protein
MTESEWLACEDPRQRLEFLRRKTTDRKLRLFAVACCRRIWHVLSDRRCREAVETGELSADGLVSTEVRSIAFRAACRARRDGGPIRRHHDEKTSAYFAASFAAAAHPITAAVNCSGYAIQHFEWKNLHSEESAFQRRVLLDLFGNLFLPVAGNPTWFTPTVTCLAQVIYKDRAFDRLPILADALEEAGCTNPDILSHCRQPGEHCRGCWVVDMLLGKD